MKKQYFQRGEIRCHVPSQPIRMMPVKHPWLLRSHLTWEWMPVVFSNFRQKTSSPTLLSGCSIKGENFIRAVRVKPGGGQVKEHTRWRWTSLTAHWSDFPLILMRGREVIPLYCVRLRKRPVSLMLIKIKVTSACSGCSDGRRTSIPELSKDMLKSDFVKTDTHYLSESKNNITNSFLRKGIVFIVLVINVFLAVPKINVLLFFRLSRSPSCG